MKRKSPPRGFRLYRQPWPTFYWRYYESNLATRSDFPVQVRGQSQGHYGEISKRFGFLERYARYEYFQYQDHISPTNSYRKNAPLLGVRGYHGKFSWYLEGEYDRFTPVSAGAGFEGPYLKIGGDYSLSENLFISSELTYRTQSQRYGGQFSRQLEAAQGLFAAGYGAPGNREGRGRFCQ